MADVAAAAARIANGAKSLVTPKEIPMAPPPPAHGDSARGTRAVRPPSSGPVVTLEMSVGKREGIRPADVVGSIANEANVPGRDIGPIDIRDEVTYVGIPAHFVEQVLDKVGKKRFRGRALNVRVASGTPPARKPYEKKTFEKKPYEKKPYEKRPFDKPFGKKPFAKKPFEKKPYAKKPPR
jgi:ATP-dependent RNA helicase DeaD